MELNPFVQEYAQQVAEIHVEGQAETFLTHLGLDFLTALYEAMASSSWCFGSVLVDGKIVAGVGIVALDTTQLFRDLKGRHWHRLLWPVARQVIRHPSLIGGVVQNLRYPVTLAAPPGEAEILFIGLRHIYMRQGIAPRLLIHLLDEAHRRGCASATAIVDRRNRALRWMVATLPGIYVDREVEMNGRTMLIYRAQLPLGSKKQEADNDQQEYS
jgi:ribosomal protein S18 acetylase RimI-like enzyme